MNDSRVIWILGVIVAVLGLGLVAGNQIAQNPLQAAKLIGLLTFIAVAVFRGVKIDGLNTYQYCFYIAYIFSLLAAFGPSKALAYCVPVLMVLIYIVYMSLQGDRKVLNSFIGVVLIWCGGTVFYAVINQYFVLQNSLICFFTYSALFPLLIIPSKYLAGELLLKRMIKVAIPVVVIETVVGLMQACYAYFIVGSGRGSAGDYVEGTLHIMPAASSSLSNAMYCFNMLFCIFAILIYTLKHHNKISKVALLGLVAVGLGTVVHLMILWVVALVVAFVIIRPKVVIAGKSGTLYPIVALGFVVLVTVGVLLSGAGHVNNRWSNIQSGQNYKVQLYQMLSDDIPQDHPSVMVVGAGPGQFGSRSAAIAAGYLGTLPPGFNYELTMYFKKYLLAMWIGWIGIWWHSVVNSPASSWFAVISEFGYIGFFVVLWGFIKLFAKTFKQGLRMPSRRLEAFALFSFALTIFLAGFPTLYWEIPQAIFVGCLFAKMFHANLFHPSADLSDYGE